MSVPSPKCCVGVVPSSADPVGYWNPGDDTGALIVIERNIGLKGTIDAGVRLDAELSYDLIVSILQRGGKPMVSFVKENLWDFVPALYQACKGVEYQP